MITTVTITGADDSIEYTELVKLSEEFPFVEWGILFSAKQAGSPRFPSLEWLHGLRDTYMRVGGMKLSMHLCGAFVRQFLKGNFEFVDVNLESLWPIFRRVQLNTHGEPHGWVASDVEEFVNNHPDKEFIFQGDNANEQILATVFGLQTIHHRIINVSTLFDLSHGAGIVPEKWPTIISGIHCGYAGGLGPDNLAEQIERIEGANIVSPGPNEWYRTPVWIDMETKVRSYPVTTASPRNDIFDLSKARQCLEIAKPFVTQINQTLEP